MTDLGRPEYIDQKMFHNLIEDWLCFFPESSSCFGRRCLRRISFLISTWKKACLNREQSEVLPCLVIALDFHLHTMCREALEACDHFCKLQHGAGGTGKADTDTEGSGGSSDNSSAGVRQSSWLSSWDLNFLLRIRCSAANHFGDSVSRFGHVWPACMRRNC